MWRSHSVTATQALNEIVPANPLPLSTLQHPRMPHVTMTARSSVASPHSLLYVDGLNYAHRFFEDRENWNLAAASASVAAFVRAAHASGWAVAVFIDAATPSAEAQAKWRERREQDVKYAERNVPYGLQELLAEMFR